MARRTAVLVLALLLALLATAEAQTAPAAPAAPGAPTPAPGVAATPTAPGASAPAAIPGALVPPQPPTAPAPGNPSNPGDFSRNPHPEMPWFGPATPYGQFLRWVWVPPRAVAVGDRVVEEPGYWVAETTAGYYHPDHWTLAQGPTGELSWRMVPRAFQSR